MPDCISIKFVMKERGADMKYFYNNDPKVKKEIIRKINNELEKMNDVDLDYVLQQVCIMNNCLDQVYFPKKKG